MEDPFDAAEWYEALTLRERAALLAADGSATAAPAPPPLASRERAERQVVRWRGETDLLDDALFAQRLAADGLTPADLVAILAEPTAGWQRRAARRPDWLRRLASVYSRPPAPPPAPPPAALPGEAAAVADLGALEFLRPLIADACNRLHEGLAHLDPAAGIAVESVAASLLPTLVRRLRWACERTLALELHAWRLEGRLDGDTSAERFASFVTLLGQPAGAVEILRRYPVLARDACRHCEQWEAACIEMAQRFAADRACLVRSLAGGTDPGAWTGARMGLSDRHGGGRSVAVLELASGLRLVYKPKPLGVDSWFQELIGWLNERGLEPPLRRLGVLDRGTYGWVEHVAAAPCATAAEAARFHRRLGAWVAIFFALEANDFHHENIIACGEHPVPIDLETLFQPSHAQVASDGPGYVPTQNTVLNSGLLPRRFWATRDELGLDLSGMGGQGGQKVGVRRIVGEGTDEMRWGAGEIELPPGPNLPTLNGQPIAPWDQVEAVREGFRDTYRLLWRRRDELLAADGPLARCAALPIRVLVRSTSVYAHLLHAANHPDFQQRALDRDRLFDRLWFDAAIYPPLRLAAPHEHADLLAGDVSLWRTAPAETDLVHPGGQRFAGYFAASGAERVAARLLAMDGDDLERQSWLVEAALEATRALDDPWQWPVRPLAADALPATAAEYIAAARRIGERLAQLAVEQDDFVTWFHLGARQDGWLLEPLPIDLYGGLSGVALFLAHLARLAGEPRFERLARRALDSARRRYDANPAALSHSGAFNGWGGIAYALTHLGRLWGDADLLASAEALVLAAMPRSAEDPALDVIAGAAGAVASILALHRHRPTPQLLAAACCCGERLLTAGVEDARGLGWPAPADPGGVRLTGFSHGSAGVAWALAWLAEASGEERFRAAARDALRYERSWFSPRHDNWADLRDGRGGASEEFLYAWCHGAPGIGLGRLGMLPHFDDAAIEPEIRAAVRATLRAGFGGSQSLCHGDLGNLELVREAGRMLGDASLAAEAERLAARILARIEGGGLRCGANPKSESLGLMVGLSGIGYGLLRAAAPDAVPSVLLLATP